MDEERLHDAAWHERVACVLSGALRVWGVSGTVATDPQELARFIVCAGATELRIVHRARGGWLLSMQTGLPSVEHAGLPGLLRRLREELAPGAAAGRLVIGAQPLLADDEHPV